MINLFKVLLYSFWREIDSPMKWAIQGYDNPRDYVQVVLEYLIGFAGLVAVAIIVFGAYTLITSSGEPENIAKGQKMITAAIIGLIIAAIAFLIVNFAIDFAANPGGGTQNGNNGVPTVTCEKGAQYPVGSTVCENGILYECMPSSSWAPIGTCSSN